MMFSIVAGLAVGTLAAGKRMRRIRGWHVVNVIRWRSRSVRQTVQQIAARIKRGQKVLVHCRAGRNRSVAFAVCVLMEMGQSEVRARYLLRKKRPGGRPIEMIIRRYKEGK